MTATFQLALMWLLIDICAAQVSSSSTQNCSNWQYGNKCLKCNCNVTNSKSCDKQTGRCICRPGFSGVNCNLDIDECVVSAKVRLCKEKHKFCKNTFGSFECLCKKGFVLSASGKCFPCPGSNAGNKCEKQCDCHAQNSASCSSDLGTCLCKPGWGGIRCDKSIDDCIGNPCKRLPCVDSHRGYICVCGKDKRYVRGRCRDFSVDMAMFDSHPVMGQVMNIYILYSLSLPYQINPTLNPDFLYDLYVNDKKLCQMSFHESYQRTRGTEWFIHRLNSGKVYHFYSHFRVRLMEPTLESLLAAPVTKEYAEMRLRFTSYIQPDSVTKCLSSMSISSTYPCTVHGAACALKSYKIKGKTKVDFM